MTGDLAPARLLVELGADVNARENGLCPIFAALNADDPQFLELLITNGADVSFIHEGDSTVTKVVNGNSKAKPSLLSMVLKHGASLNHSEEDLTPLMHAAFGYAEQRNAELRYAVPLYAEYAVEMCEILILHGADVNARNSKDETALHFSVQGINIKTPRLLLSQGADVNAQDQNGESVLHTAASSYKHYRPNFDIQELLLQSGANPIIKSRAGKSPFQNFLIRFLSSVDPQIRVLEDYIQLFADFGPSPSDLIATACADKEAMKLAAGLEDVAILKLLLSHGGISSDGILRECIYSSFDHPRPQNLRVLIKHPNPFRVADNKHMSFLFLIKISRDIHFLSWRSDANIAVEIRAQTTKPLPIRYRRAPFPMDEYCDILKEIWDAGFNANTILDEKFVNFVSTYRGKFSSLVRDAEEFGNPSSSSPRRETISAVIFAAQHVPSANVVLALLKVNSRRDDFTDEEILEAFIRSAVYDNLEVYDGFRNTFLRRVDGDSAEGGQTQESSDRALERPVSQELRRAAEVFPSSEGQCRLDFYRAFCQAMRAEGFERKTFADGRTLFELAKRAENWELLDTLKGASEDRPIVD